jgi:predicted MFS family arabinose efflux permease
MKPAQYAWVLVGLLWVVALLNYLDRQVIFSVFPLLQADLHLSTVQLGLLSTVFLWVYGLLSPVCGFAADRFGRRRMILFSLLVWSLVTWATGHARNFNELIGARALMGVSESCYIPAALALIADYHGERSRSLATGIHQSGLYIGIVLGGVGGGWLGEHYGWRPVFTILGVTGVVYMVVLALSLKRAPAPRDAGSRVRELTFRAALRELLSLPSFWLMLTVFSVVAMANWVVYTWLALYLYERFSMSLTAAGFSATFYLQVSSLGGILLGGWLADRWAARTARGRLFVQVAGLLVVGPFLFLAGFTASKMLLVVGLVFVGLGRGFYDCNTMPVLCQIARPNLRSTGYGLFNLASCLAGGATAVAAGSLKTTIGLGGAIEIVAILVFLSAFVLLMIRVDPPVRSTAT